MAQIDYSFAKLSDPLLVHAERRKALYQELVDRYDRGGWWGRFKMSYVECLHMPTVREVAADSIDEHLAWIEAH